MKELNIVYREVIRESRNKNKTRLYTDVYYESDFAKIYWRNWVYKYEKNDPFTGLPIFRKTKKGA